MIILCFRQPHDIVDHILDVHNPPIIELDPDRYLSNSPIALPNPPLPTSPLPNPPTTLPNTLPNPPTTSTVPSCAVSQPFLFHFHGENADLKLQIWYCGRFESKIMQTQSWWIISFSAGQWCEPCMTLMPSYRKVAKELYGTARAGYPTKHIV